jgi:phosphatidylglycerophosphate synthase
MPENRTFAQVRSGLYQDVYRAELQLFGIDLSDWRKHPYTKLKSYYYIEAGAILAFFLLKTSVRPNTITLIYAFMGVAGAVLFATGIPAAIAAGIFIFFSKAIPDWIDGHIARLKNQTSRLGGLLDSWGAKVNLLSFQTAICLYLAQVEGSDVYYLLAVIISLASAVNFRSYIFEHTAKAVSIAVQDGEQMTHDTEPQASSSAIDIARMLVLFLRYDGRSRYTDAVLLVVLIELYTGRVLITPILVWIWTALSLLYFLYSIARVFRDQEQIFNQD